jgi:ribosomal protein S18 acetylase RimI-like enzyme
VSAAPLARLALKLPVTIRACRQEDVRLLEWEGLFTPHRAIIEEAWRRHVGGTNVMIVADMSGYPVAQVWIDLEKLEEGSAAVLWALRVHPVLQRAGLGSRLLREAERWLISRGFSVVEIGVDKSNPEALRLYERLGYHVDRGSIEQYQYVTPDGTQVDAVADLWMLRKPLAAGVPR